MKNCEDCSGYVCNWNESGVEDRKYCPRFDITAWQPSNIYGSARLGVGVSVGRFVEIGHNVSVGENTRIGKGAFIPEGVAIGADVFIGPHACFSNDMYPPSPSDKWEKTMVEDGARIGANVSVRPGVTIKKGALVGMGAVVTKDIPKGETWAGCPAVKIKKKGGWPKGKPRK